MVLFCFINLYNISVVTPHFFYLSPFLPSVPLLSSTSLPPFRPSPLLYFPPSLPSSTLPPSLPPYLPPSLPSSLPSPLPPSPLLPSLPPSLLPPSLSPSLHPTTLSSPHFPFPLLLTLHQFNSRLFAVILFSDIVIYFHFDTFTDN